MRAGEDVAAGPVFGVDDGLDVGKQSGDPLNFIEDDGLGVGSRKPRGSPEAKARSSGVSRET